MSGPELNDNHYPNATSSAPSSEHTAAAVRADFGLSFSGYHSPFPPPSVLDGYKAIDPKILAVIMDMTVQEQEHRHGIENKEVEIVERSRKIEAKAIEDDFRFGGRGQWIAFSLAVIFLPSLLFWLCLVWKQPSAPPLLLGVSWHCPNFLLPGFFRWNKIKRKNFRPLDSTYDCAAGNALTGIFNC
jgi:hypothetical protein